MELEQRIKILEEELQILKNQIQRSLLDIQEQLVTKGHSDLQGGGRDYPGQSTPTVMQATPVVTFSPNVSPNANTLQQNDAEVSAPIVRKVVKANAAPVRESMDEVVIQSKPISKPKAPAKPASKEVDWTAMAELEAWASQQVTRIGAKRTRDLIKRYSEEGRFSRKVRDDLFSLITTYEEVLHERNMRAAVPATPISVQSPLPEVKKTKSPMPKTAPSRSTSEIERTENASRTVLRLIAGVQNASMGVQWKKKNNG